MDIRTLVNRLEKLETKARDKKQYELEEPRPRIGTG